MVLSKQREIHVELIPLHAAGFAQRQASTRATKSSINIAWLGACYITDIHRQPYTTRTMRKLFNDLKGSVKVEGSVSLHRKWDWNRVDIRNHFFLALRYVFVLSSAYIKAVHLISRIKPNWIKFAPRWSDCSLACCCLRAASIIPHSLPQSQTFGESRS